MTQEHLQNLMERAVEKVNTDNNENDFIRTCLVIETTEHENEITGRVSVYERPYAFRLSQTRNVMTGTTEYKFGSDFDGNTYCIPHHPDRTLGNNEVQQQLVNKVCTLINTKRVDIQDAPLTSTQELITDQMYDIWRDVKQLNGYPEWALKVRPSGDPNKMYFQMNALGQQSIIALGRYETHEEYPEGCLTLQTTRQPLEYHSSKMKEGGLCEAVMDHILYELSMIHEDMISDVSPNRKEIER